LLQTRVHFFELDEHSQRHAAVEAGSNGPACDFEQACHWAFEAAFDNLEC
jgi:hypothetical protein